MPVPARSARYAPGLMFGLLLALAGLAVVPLAGTPVDAASTRGEPLGIAGCGQWLPLEALAGAEDIRRPTSPLILRRPGEPEADVFRAPARARVSREFLFRPMAGEPRRHAVVSDWGRRPLRL
jgi:hypothetical protein